MAHLRLEGASDVDVVVAVRGRGGGADVVGARTWWWRAAGTGVVMAEVK